MPLADRDAKAAARGPPLPEQNDHPPATPSLPSPPVAATEPLHAPRPAAVPKKPAASTPTATTTKEHATVADYVASKCDAVRQDLRARMDEAAERVARYVAQQCSAAGQDTARRTRELRALLDARIDAVYLDVARLGARLESELALLHTLHELQQYGTSANGNGNSSEEALAKLAEEVHALDSLIGEALGPLQAHMKTQDLAIDQVSATVEHLQHEYKALDRLWDDIAADLQDVKRMKKWAVASGPVPATGSGVVQVRAEELRALQKSAEELCAKNIVLEEKCGRLESQAMEAAERVRGLEMAHKSMATEMELINRLLRQQQQDTTSQQRCPGGSLAMEERVQQLGRSGRVTEVNVTVLRSDMELLETRVGQVESELRRVAAGARQLEEAVDSEKDLSSTSQDNFYPQYGAIPDGDEKGDDESVFWDNRGREFKRALFAGIAEEPAHRRATVESCYSDDEGCSGDSLDEERYKTIASGRGWRQLQEKESAGEEVDENTREGNFAESLETPVAKLFEPGALSASAWNSHR